MKALRRRYGRARAHYSVGQGSRSNVAGWVAYTEDIAGKPGVVFGRRRDALEYARLRNTGALDEASEFADDHALRR
jgi:hypothetical protein